MHLKKPSFRRTDSSSSWTHKSDSLPNFGVNNREHPRGPAAHGLSRPPAPLQAAAASSEFRPAAHQPSSLLHLPVHLLQLPKPPIRVPRLWTRQQEARRPVPVVGAGRHRRQRLHLDPTLKPMRGEPLAVLLPFPGRFRRWSTGIWAGAAGNHAQGPNCRRPALFREFYANQGTICESLNLSEGLVTKLYL
jgi:hypothetical protein